VSVDVGDGVGSVVCIAVAVGTGVCVEVEVGRGVNVPVGTGVGVLLGMGVNVTVNVGVASAGSGLRVDVKAGVEVRAAFSPASHPTRKDSTMMVTPARNARFRVQRMSIRNLPSDHR
jgi:hypothetical protein